MPITSLCGGSGDRSDGADRSGTGARRRGGGLGFTVGVTALDIGGAIAAYQLARRAGASDAAAYLISSVGPVCGAAVVWLRARAASGASIAVMAFTTLSALAVLIGSRDAQMLLYKDAVVTAVIGLIFAGSLLLSRPLAFYFGQRFFTDGTHQAINAWNQLWEDPRFRRANSQVTTVWAVSYLLAAAGKAWLIHRARFNTAYTGTQILPIAAAGIATALTIAITRHYARTATPQRHPPPSPRESSISPTSTSRSADGTPASAVSGAPSVRARPARLRGYQDATLLPEDEQKPSNGRSHRCSDRQTAV